MKFATTALNLALLFPSTALLLYAGSVHISGVTNSVTDLSATGVGSYLSSRFLRFTGVPAPAGYSHGYQWAAPNIALYPEASPVTLSGTIDLTPLSVGGTALIGLVDTGLLSAGGIGYQSGAYLYIAYVSGVYRIGTTDGNKSAELAQNFIDIPPTDLPASKIINVVFTVNGAADPATCADILTPPYPAGSTGCMYLELSGFAAGLATRNTKDSYGAIKRRDSAYGGLTPDTFYDATYTYDEFASLKGAMVGWDSSSGAVNFELDVAPVATPYSFTGFFQPVYNDPVVNVLQAGRAVPFKWRILDGSTPVSDPASFVGFYSYPVACGSFEGDASSPVQELAKGQSGLQYLGDGNWQFNWDSLRQYANSCRIAYLELADGTKHYAQFTFRK